MQQGSFIVKNIKVTDLSHERRSFLRESCCLELISALELLVTHGLSASGVIFHLSFVPLCDKT